MPFMRFLRTFLNLALLLTLAVPCLGAGFNAQNVGVLAALTRPAAGSSLVSSNSLQSYLKLDGNLNDEFGDAFTDNIGTVSYGAAKINNGAAFSWPYPDPGTYASHSSDTRFDLQGNWTISVWVNLSDVSIDSYIISKDTSGNGYFLVYQAASTNFQMYSKTSGGSLEWVTSAEAPLSTATWYHVVAQLTGTTLRIKVNNGSWTTQTVGGDTQTNSDQIAIGNSADGANGCNASVDGVSIWKRVLSDGEITQIYNGGNKARPQLP